MPAGFGFRRRHPVVQPGREIVEPVQRARDFPLGAEVALQPDGDALDADGGRDAVHGLELRDRRRDAKLVLPHDRHDRAAEILLHEPRPFGMRAGSPVLKRPGFRWHGARYGRARGVLGC